MPSSRTSTSSKRVSPRPPPSPRLPHRLSTPPSITCCGVMISVRAAVLAAVALVVFSSIAWTCVSWEVAPEPELYSFQIVNEYPHDPSAFTQGLLYVENDTLFESTGLYHQSSIRKVHLQSGKVLNLHEMDGSFFGEGLTLLGSRLFQVTWLTKTGFIYDQHSLSQLGRFTHQMQDGWGLATDGNVLFGSDGTSSLYIMDPQNFRVTKKLTVKYEDSEVRYLNELEYIKGEVWANVWQTDCIARISPNDGKVLSWILLHPLRQTLIEAGYSEISFVRLHASSGNDVGEGIDVLNGIAWDKVNDRLFVTGKLWPTLYEVKLRPAPAALKLQAKYLCKVY